MKKVSRQMHNLKKVEIAITFFRRKALVNIKEK